MCLSDTRDLEYSIADASQNDFIVYHVKLTDSALKILENLSLNPNASFKLSLDGDHGSFEIPQQTRKCHYTFSAQPAPAVPEAFQDCISFRSRKRVISYGRYASRLIVNAKDDSFEMARERMAQVENEQRNSCAKQLSSGAKTKKSSTVKPRNVSNQLQHKNPPPMTSTSRESISSSNSGINNFREIVISLLALRAHNLAELHQKLKCRNEASLKGDLNHLLKEVAQCTSDGSFQLLPKFYQEVNLDWSGYTPVDRIKIEHLKKKHSKPLSSSHKLAIVDEAKIGLLSTSQLLRKHAISSAQLDQWLANEDQLRESVTRGQKKSGPGGGGGQNMYANQNAMRISTAPRLPSAASRTAAGGGAPRGNNPYLAMGQGGSGSNSAPVSAEGSQTGCSSRRIAEGVPMSKEYPIVQSMHSQKSSSGCSSMASSILSSPQQHQGLAAYVSKEPQCTSYSKGTDSSKKEEPMEEVSAVAAGPSDRQEECYYKKEPRISSLMPVEDPVEVATRIARSMIEEEEEEEEEVFPFGPSDEFWPPSEEAISCNSGPFFTPEQTGHEFDNPMAFDHSFRLRIDAHQKELSHLYPEVHSLRDARGYKHEFDKAYPQYLDLRQKSNERWSALKRLHEELQDAVAHQLETRYQLAQLLSSLVRDACSERRQEEELQLSVLDAKLRLLKSRIAHFLEHQQQRPRNRKRHLNHSQSHNKSKNNIEAISSRHKEKKPKKTSSGKIAL